MDPRPGDWQPRLRWWGHAWRLVLVLLVSAVVWLPVRPSQGGPQLALDVALGVVALVLVHLRRRRPVALAVVISVLSAFSGTAAGPAVLASVSLATRRRWREVVPVALLGTAAALAFAAMYPPEGAEPFWLTVSINVVATTAIFGWGMYLGSRRELLWTLRQRAERAEAEQELRAEQARGNERARIAREMHDVLAHRITQISLHSGALAYRDGLDAEQVRASAAVVQQQAHRALSDLRGVLGVLREGRPGTPLAPGGALAPQPTYDDLPQLLDDAREGGLLVSWTDDLGAASADLPDPVGRAIYRIVQEGLTNVRKHAPGARVDLRVSGGPDDGLRLRLVNPLGFGTGVPGAGLGLVGLAERAALLGGRLEHRREAGRFVVETWIPWAAA